MVEMRMSGVRRSAGLQGLREEGISSAILVICSSSKP